MTKTNEKDPRTFAVIGAAMAVYNELGYGFLESVYHEALAIEFSHLAIPFAHEVNLPIYYRGRRLETSYRADFVCYDSIIVELKALSAITGVERAQIINYLKASRFSVGLLINFGAKSLQFERFAGLQAQSVLSSD